MGEASAFEEALSAALRPGEKFSAHMAGFQGFKIESISDAAAVARAVDLLGDSGGKPTILSPANGVVSLFLQASSREAFEVLRDEGIPRLVRFYDRQSIDSASRSDMMLLTLMLKVFAMYGTDAGLERIWAAVRKPLDPGGFMWSVVFRSVRPAAAGAMVEGLRRTPPPPGSFMAVAALDFATARQLAGEQEPHLFDTDEGVAQMEAWLLDASRASYGVSCAATLAFIKHPARDRLLALALDHSAIDVQLEAAWAAAKLGRRGGIDLLARLATEPAHAKKARKYLEELGRSDAIPASAQTPAARAVAEMCQWLASPHEMGRPPDDIAVVDQRVLFWPPTNDRRPVWLFKYTYREPDAAKGDTVGIGMVGSVTFALFGEATADLSPDDVYALHCCWELQWKKDPRAPAKRSVADGRRILEEYNS